MELFYSKYWQNPPVNATVHYFHENPRHHYHFHCRCKMHLCCLKILLTIPLCNIIPCLLQLNFVFILPTYIFLQSYSELFVFYTHKRTQNSFMTIRHFRCSLYTYIYINGCLHRNIHSQIFFKIGVLKNFANLTGKHLCWSEVCNFTKKRLQHGCFPVKFPKFLRTSSFAEHLRWVLLYTLPLFTLTCLYLFALTYLYLGSLYTII